MFHLLLLMAVAAIALVLQILVNDSQFESLIVAYMKCRQVNEAPPLLPPPTPAPSPDATPPPSPSGRNQQAASFEQELTSKLLRVRLHT